MNVDEMVKGVHDALAVKRVETRSSATASSSFPLRPYAAGAAEGATSARMEAAVSASRHARSAST